MGILDTPITLRMVLYCLGAWIAFLFIIALLVAFVRRLIRSRRP